METALPFIEEKPLFMRLAEIAEYSALTEAQQMQYDESLDNYLSYYNSIKYKEKKARRKSAKGLIRNCSQQPKPLRRAEFLFLS